jgi:hypothetical protein
MAQTGDQQIITRPGPGRSSENFLLRIFVRAGQRWIAKGREATVSEFVSYGIRY